MTMSNVWRRKTAIWLFALVFLFSMVGLAFSVSQVKAETGETTEKVLADLDFEEDADADGFKEIWTGWGISEGVFKPVVGWASTYFMQDFSFAEHDLKISMDFYYESALNVGLTTDPEAAASDASTGDGIGVRLGTQDVSVKTSIGGSADTWLSAANVTFNDGKVHSLEIVFKPEKTVTVKVDGKELNHSENTSLSLTDVSFANQYDFTQGQLVFKTSDPNAYIDNLKISQIVPAETGEQPVPEPIPNAEYSFSFEEDTDGNSFSGAYYSGWEIKEGHFRPAAGGASTYFTQMLSFAEKDLKITLDFNYKTGFYIGLSGEPKEFASDAGDKNEAVDGIAVQFGDGSIGLSGSLERGKWLNGSDEKLNDGESHRLEILFKTNQTVTVTVDGTELCHSAGSLPAFTDFSFANEFPEGFTQGYLVMKGFETETYIDNLKIENLDAEPQPDPQPDPSLSGDIALDFTADDSANGYFTTALYAGWEVREGVFKPTVAWADTYLMQAFSFAAEELKIEMDFYFQSDSLSIGFSDNYKISPDGSSSASDGIALRFSVSGVGMYTSVDGGAEKLAETSISLSGSLHRLGIVFKTDKTVSVTIDGEPLADMTDVDFGSVYDFTEGYLVLKSPDAAAYIDNLTVTGEETEISDVGGSQEPEEPFPDEPVYDEPIDYRLTVGDLVSQKHPDDPTNDYWMGAPGNDKNAYFTSWNTANPGSSYAVAIAFTAPADGSVAPDPDGNIGWAYRAAGTSQGDGRVRTAIFLNNDKIFPVSNASWARLSVSSDKPTQYAVEAFEMKAGDVLYVVFENGGDGNSDYDTLEYSLRFYWSDAIYTDLLFDAGRKEEGDKLGGCGWMTAEEGEDFYSDGTTVTTYKKSSLLSYHYVTVLECPPVGDAVEVNVQTITPVVTEELMFSEAETGSEHYYHLTDTHCYAYSGQANPGLYYALGICWTAPVDGRVDISGTYVENYMYQATPNEGGLKSDGVRVCVLLNKDKVVYPSAGHWYTVNSPDRVYFDQPVFNVKAGETLTFVLDKNGESNWDSCDYNITIRFAADGERFTEIYNSKTDFMDHSDTAAFKYLAIDFSGEEEDRLIPPLAVLAFSDGGGNGNLALIIGLSAGGGIVVIAAVILIILTKKGVFKKKGGAEQ